MFREGTTHQCIRSDEDVRKLGDRKEEIFEKCREHRIRLVLETAPQQYFDYISGNTYELYVGATWPGSADDAATYGSLNMTEKAPEK